MSRHIFPDHSIFVSREQKEKKLQQRGRVLWFTGLSGSGKSTIAAALEKHLSQSGFYTVVLDGDNVRNGINSNLGFGEADRYENIRRIAEVSKLFVQNGAIVICCFVSPTEDLRRLAREIIGDDFYQIFIDTPLEICELRDVKGLYAKARKGEIKDFTGISAPFEAPSIAELHIHTEDKTVDENMMEIYNKIHSMIKY